ncbi:MAG: VWA domain-containing protein [Methanosarcinaceae archaeon]|nr:VWA domain-containing protein [Methanosarcinaceae archaeon]
MSDEETARRLRRNLSRNYDIRVMHIGGPVLGLRIPRTSVSGISKADTDTLYGLLDSNIGQLRPAEIGAVYFIADSDHLQADPVLFFRPFLEGRDGCDPVFGKEASSSSSIHASSEGPGSALTDEPSGDGSLPFDGTIEVTTENEFDCVIGRCSPAERSSPLSSSREDADMMRIEDDPVFFMAEAATGNDAEVVVELTPREYIPGGGDKEDKYPLAQGLEEGLLPGVSGKPFRERQDDRVVGKILNEFARNSQKKRLASGRLKSGRRAEVLTKSKRGRYVRFRMPGEKVTDIAIAPTVRAAAFRARDGKIDIKKSDIREKVRRRRISSLINIVFDTSGSMDDREKIRITTDVVVALLKDAYQKRDRVSLVTYCGRSAELVLPFTSSVEAAKRYLEKVPFGGTTPLASGMLTGLDTLLRELKKEPSAVPIMILVTDGTANCALHLGGNIRREVMQVCRQLSQHHINVLIIDISKSGSKLCHEMAMQGNGSYYHPGSLSREDIYSAICEERNSKTAFA